MMTDSLGFKCGQHCPHCGDKVSRDGQGRYLCFTCGKLVQIVVKSDIKAIGQDCPK